jgi:Uncharacterized conserved protein
MNQKHGKSISVWQGGEPELKAADIAIVDASKQDAVRAPAACVVTADCVPILFWSEAAPVWAAVHAGRVGLELGVIDSTLEALSDLLVTDLRYTIGPFICKECYEVDQKTAENWDSQFVRFTPTPHLDLAGYAKSQIGRRAIFVGPPPRCTLHDRGWYSYRGKKTQMRNVSYIYLPKN